jgi:RNA polymerase sigma-70 factor, ECF subfamily
LLELTPDLDRYARKHCSSPDMAKDLVQETLAHAWKARCSFEAETNMRAWLFTILRHEISSDWRRARRRAGWDDSYISDLAAGNNEQFFAAMLADTVQAMGSLCEAQQDALLLVAAGGVSYVQAAKICGCAVGTLKSRVARARRTLTALMDARGRRQENHLKPGSALAVVEHRVMQIIASPRLH